MYRRSSLHLAILAAMTLPATANAGFFEDIEVNGFLKNETAIFLNDGQVTGEARNMLDNSGHNAGDLLKFENSARFFINGYLGDYGSWHLDLNIICDSEGVNSDYKCHESYTQNDWLRELYADFSVGDWNLRLGKQQVVWGTADGIKLLDIINPTDYREMAQNAMEDSRIPIWMLNAERNIGENGNIQFIVSENRKNAIPGLNRDGDSGHPFIMKGVDSITGDVNGFLNVTPALASVAGSFNGAAMGGMFTGNINMAGLLPFAGLTVDGFASTPVVYGFPCPPTGCDGTQTPVPFGPGYIVLNNIAQNGLYPGDPNANNNETNLMDVNGPQVTQVSWDPSNPRSAFEYMPNATFATFNTFTNVNFTPQGPVFSGAETKYVVNEPDPERLNAGLRYRGSLDNGLNFGINYFYHYSANPEINLSWRDAVTGEKLEVLRARGMVVGTDPSGNPVIMPNPGDIVSANDVGNNAMTDLDAMPTILLMNSAGQFYGAFDPTTGMPNANQNGVYMEMEETRSRVNSIGGSLDYGTQWGDLPVVLRAEVLYDKGEKQPIVDKRLLGIGDLTNALTMEDMDKFSYVIGVDVTVLTNMLVSAQFIQQNNLDFVDDKRTCTTQAGNTYDCSRYTGDFSTLHLTNGMNKGWENKEFYSLFLSKPFGESQLGRWNNIIMYEDGGGFWNRFDVEYSFSDEFIGSAELNFYWGDEDTTFGQFKNSSNAQIGLKYLWE
ncbi:RNA polymerase-associated protein rapA [Thiolapillus sp.]